MKFALLNYRILFHFASILMSYGQGTLSLLQYRDPCRAKFPVCWALPSAMLYMDYLSVQGEPTAVSTYSFGLWLQATTNIYDSDPNITTFLMCTITLKMVGKSWPNNIIRLICKWIYYQKTHKWCLWCFLTSARSPIT